MNVRFIVSVAIIFVLSIALGAAIHGMVLGADYARLVETGTMRNPEAASRLMPYMFAANLLFAIGFTWIYRAGRDNRPWPGQGVRFGVAVALLATIPTYLTYYVVTPLPSDLVAKQAALGLIAMVVLGIVAAFVNRDPAPPRA